MLYKRLLTISVGEPGKEGVILDGIRCSFRIVRTDKPEANTIDLEIYNLAEATRAKFETVNHRIVLETGYETTGMQVLAIGDIVKGHTIVTVPDATTFVSAADGGRSMRDARASVSYKSGTSAKQMVNDLVKMLGVDSVEISIDLEKAFRQGWSYAGPASGAMTKLAAAFGFDWSIQNNTLQITERGQTTGRESLLITPAFGLIGSPTPLDDVGTESTKGKEKREPEPGYTVECLLNPAIVPGDPVTIEARAGKGRYRVRKVEHSGDAFGNEWTTRLTVSGAPLK